jgi:pyruvate dehydrogenase E1 component alpha subunit
MGTDFRRVSAVTDFSLMGKSYGIQGKQVDGMDVLAVYEAVHAEVERIRTEKQPGFLEIRTYRYKGHSMSDPAKYRTKEEVTAYQKQDPILLLKAQMVQQKMMTEEQYQAIDIQIKQRCDETVTFAEQSAEPAIAALEEDVFA